MADSPVSSPLEQLSSGMADAVAAASGSVVAVHAGRSRASGFAWRDGLVVTCEEALPDDAADLTVSLPGGASAQATLVGRDAGTDIALLRVEAAALSPIAFDATGEASAPARSPWRSGPPPAHRSRPPAWSRCPGPHGAACAAAKSMLVSNWDWRCAAAPKAAWRSMRSAAPSA